MRILKLISFVLFITSSQNVSASTRGSRSAKCERNPSRPLFVWAEWPELYKPTQWRNYFDTLLSFASGNCGNFVIPKIVMRVTDPEWAGLFTVGRESSFFTDFLSRIPEGVDLRIYPYFFTTEAQDKWAAYSGTGRPLEGVFKYAKEWNKLLSKERLPVRITAVVADSEERHGFEAEQRRVPQYKRTYGIPTFAVGIGFDALRHREYYPSADEFYMEMYDFYDVHHEGLPAKRVETSHKDKPHSFLEVLHRKSLHPFVRSYDDPRMHFMWSVQARSKRDCIYPLEGTCGLSDDFGWFSAGDFNTFMGLVQERYPVFSGRSHGIFQFNYVPPSWL